MRDLDKFRGCLFGGAAGDALGYAVEFDRYGEIVRRFGERGITRYELDGDGVAEISDDTQMSLFTASGILLGMTRGCMRGIMGSLDDYCRKTYVDWLHTQEWRSRSAKVDSHSWLMDVPELYSQRAPGTTCLTALRSLEDGVVASNNSCGCGGVMRTAPIALLCSLHIYADKLRCDRRFTRLVRACRGRGYGRLLCEYDRLCGNQLP